MEILVNITEKDFLFRLLEAATSRSLENTDICIVSKPNKNDCIENYKIYNISNHGCNDAIFIEIEKH